MRRFLQKTVKSAHLQTQTGMRTWCSKGSGECPNMQHQTPSNSSRVAWAPGWAVSQNPSSHNRCATRATHLMPATQRQHKDMCTRHQFHPPRSSSNPQQQQDPHTSCAWTTRARCAW
jgi:hypothetical protein